MQWPTDRETFAGSYTHLNAVLFIPISHGTHLGHWTKDICPFYILCLVIQTGPVPDSKSSFVVLGGNLEPSAPFCFYPMAKWVTFVSTPTAFDESSQHWQAALSPTEPIPPARLLLPTMRSGRTITDGLRDCFKASGTWQWMKRTTFWLDGIQGNHSSVPTAKEIGTQLLPVHFFFPG